MARRAEMPIAVNVMGELAVLRNGEPVDLPPSKKTRALLAYLALSERPQRRERLCEIFWDVPDDPRGSLRWSLSKLRRVLKLDGEAALEADRNTVALRRDLVGPDMDALADVAERDLSDCSLDELESAADVFRGRFLEDLSLPRCPDFEAWRTAHVDEMEVLHARVLEELVRRLADRPGDALRHAHALRALRPDDATIDDTIRRLRDLARRGGDDDAPDPAPEPAERGADEGLAFAAPAPIVAQVGSNDRRQEIRYCTTHDGVRVAYALAGEGPPVVRAAHWMSHLQYDWDSPVWRHWMEALSDGMHLVRYDERGNGMSERRVEDLSFEAMIADLEAIVDAAGLERFTLLGVSQSCAVSVAYAVRHPERVSGLVLYGGYVKGWRKRGIPAELSQREALKTLIRHGWGQDQSVFRQVFTSLFIPGATREQMDWFNELQRMTTSPEGAIRLQDTFADIDVTELLPRVTAPTLVLHARGDAVAPFQSGQEFARRIPGARFVALDSANHILLEPEPAFRGFVAELRSFVRETTKARSQPTPDRTRKQITALSAEIVSPLQVLDQGNLDQMIEVLDPMIDLACETVESHGGSIVSSSDSTVTAIWGVPLATEDHAYRASRAALALKKNLETTWPGEVRVRVALDSGDAIVRPKRGNGHGALDAVSTAVRRATQLAASLQRSTVAVTADTRSLIGGYMKMERLKGGQVRSAAPREQVYELLAENRALCRWHLRANQGLTRLVGREPEMALLARSWQLAREGHGQLVGIVADPGLGKSRLSHEFIAGEALRSVTVIECGALEFDADVAFQVARRMLRSLFGLGESVGGDEAVGIVTRALEEIGAATRFSAPIRFVLELPADDASWLERDAADRIDAVRESVRAVLWLQCRQRPVVLLVEDLHWIDAESEGVLDEIVEGMAAQRLLVIATYRPEYPQQWSHMGAFQQIRLGALSPDETQEFLKSMLGDHPSVDHLRPMLAEKSDGTPLFLEEMVRMLAETGQLSGEPGAYRASGHIGEVQVPPSVKPVIAARIDRLEPEDRRMLQIAAVIGKDIPRPILKALSGLKREELNAAIRRLNKVELLFELQSYPEVEYTFKHALTYDVAYESLLSDDRKRIHAEALALMEGMFGGQVPAYAERLARHALVAEQWNAAAKYLLMATDRALDLAAFSKAARFLDQAARAVDMLEDTPERRAQAIDIRTRMRPALEGIDQFATAIERLDEAEALATGLGDTTRLEQVLLHKSYAYSTHGRLDLAIEAADRLREIAGAAGDARFAAEADLAAAQGLVFRSHSKEVLARLEPHLDAFTGDWRMERFGLLGTRSVFFLGYISMSAALTGDLERARKAAEAMNAAVEESGRPIDRYSAAFHEATLNIVSGPDEAYERRLAAIAEECRIKAPSPFYPWLLSRLGHVGVLRGRPEQASETLDEAMRRAERSDMPHVHLYAQALRAIAECQLSGPAALPMLRGVLDEARARSDPLIEVYALRAIADVSPPKEALKHLDRAERVAVARGYRPEQAKICAARGEIAELHDAELSRRAYAEARALFAEIGLEGFGAAALGSDAAAAKLTEGRQRPLPYPG